MTIKTVEGTLYITTKLKRVKILRFLADLILILIKLPLIIFYWLGKLAETISNIITELYYMFENNIIRFLKWNEVAEKQYKKNPDKFK